MASAPSQLRSPLPPCAFWGFPEKGHLEGVKYQLRDGEGVRATEGNLGGSETFPEDPATQVTGNGSQGPRPGLERWLGKSEADLRVASSSSWQAFGRHPGASGEPAALCSEPCHLSRRPLRTFHTVARPSSSGARRAEMVGLCSAGEQLSLQSPLPSVNEGLLL